MKALRGLVQWVLDLVMLRRLERRVEVLIARSERAQELLDLQQERVLAQLDEVKAATATAHLLLRQLEGGE